MIKTESETLISTRIQRKFGKFPKSYPRSGSIYLSRTFKTTSSVSLLQLRRLTLRFVRASAKRFLTWPPYSGPVGKTKWEARRNLGNARERLRIGRGIRSRTHYLTRVLLSRQTVYTYYYRSIACARRHARTPASRRARMRRYEAR